MRTARKQEIIRQLHDIRDTLMDLCIELNTPATASKPKRTPTTPKPKQPQYKGDTGRFRKALRDCGWTEHADSSVFHDKRKSWSRIKLWFANQIYEATQAEQETLEAAIRKEFGDRVIKMGFTEGMPWANGDCQKQLCVWLKH